jgi:hypothetical protein
MVVSRVLVLICALLVIAVAAEGANAGLKPQAPPQPRADSTSLQPDPWPSTSGESSPASRQVSSSASTHVSSSVSISTPVVRRTPATVPKVHARSRPAVAQPQRHTPPHQTAGPRALVELSGWPVGPGAAAGLNELRRVASSSSHGTPLLAAALALMLIVIAETSFLRLAGSRRGAAKASASSQRRRVDEPVAIRRVQLRR